VPLLVTLAEPPAWPVLVVPTETVAAAPGLPDGPVGPVGPVGPAIPCGPCGPVAPCGPAGMPKLNTAALDVPLLLTVAGDPAVKVLVVPTEIVAAVPGGPPGPGEPVGPVGPVGPALP